MTIQSFPSDVTFDPSDVPGVPECARKKHLGVSTPAAATSSQAANLAGGDNTRSAGSSSHHAEASAT